MLNKLHFLRYLNLSIIVIIICIILVTGQVFAKHGEGFNLVLSPQLGFVRLGQPETGDGPPSGELVIDHGWTLGGLVHGIHNRFIFEAYPFYGKVGDIKTIGDIAYIDVYPLVRENFKVNIGMGLVTIFNRTDSADTDIISPFPLGGVKFYFGKYGSYFNPWVGFMYDMIDVDIASPMAPDTKERYKSLLLGARLGYKPLPFLNFVFKFYYKRCLDDVEEKNTFNLVNRNVIYFTENIGATTYLDYRQYIGGGYMMMLVGGPAFVF